MVGLVIKQLKKGSLLSLRVHKFLKSVNIWQSYEQERDCLVHYLRFASTLLKDGESARNNHFAFGGNLPERLSVSVPPVANDICLTIRRDT